MPKFQFSGGGGGGGTLESKQNTQSAKICLNFNFLGEGGTLESKLKILKVPRYA